jgi:superoxide reductase
MLYYQPKDAKFPLHIATFEFLAHGASAEGPNQGSTYTHHRGGASMKTGQSGTLYALAYCNIHGLWESSRELNVR